MSMSTHVIGFRKADEKWEQMKSVWNACERAGIEAPKEVYEYFNHNNPNTLAGIEVSISSAITEYCDDMQEGYEVDITKLPPDVTVIRFYNSW